jgi:formamidopyrimidine-DNA glycosylase
MPELPEVETAKRQLNCIVGRTIKKVYVKTNGGADIKLRVPVPTKQLQKLMGKEISEVKRRGKYLFIHCGNLYLVCHFGMTGMVFINRETPHMVFKLILDDGSFITYCDTRRFGSIGLVKADTVRQFIVELGVGVEPLTKKFNPIYLRSLLEASRAPIKDWLLDQRLVAGIGNIYASEICHAAGLLPTTPANQCVDYSKLICRVTKRILRAAIDAGGSTVNSYSTPNGESGRGQHLHKVYGRAGLKCDCGNYIIKTELKGRSTYYCAKCQH